MLYCKAASPTKDSSKAPAPTKGSISMDFRSKGGTPFGASPAKARPPGNRQLGNMGHSREPSKTSSLGPARSYGPRGPSPTCPGCYFLQVSENPAINYIRGGQIP